ncbi:2OG-Fe(II) oxygenase [Bradyrhizobium brasilense]|uniref:2OG-Fe(II) oxygenase n=1 Tax=Bradyrhizobium brasilense TaxID=1419277 RepID=UPI0024B23657|nr:2OG-Fe(II) oxygenase [Bradyrhizobium australafricanum]WFU31431.1 2OG-Fe(II) oxygenase [Bradyrhizobium australafricanum]
MSLSAPVLYPEVLPPQRCAQLIAEMSGRLSPAMFWTKGERVYDPKVREAFNCKWVDEDLAGLTCGLIGRHERTAIARERVEPMEIVCYPPGNGSERHLDGPHRSHSIVYFLNSGYGGGELAFDSGEVFRNLPVGSAVVWQNGPEAWHACLPITSGFKWIVVSWVRHAHALGAESEIHAQFRPKAEAESA